MMLVTTAHNDADLRTYLKRALGREVIFAAIPHGDVNSYGMWLGGEKCRLLFERKKLGDIISCMDNGRYLAQWQNAKEDGGWERQYLFAEIEKRYRENRKTGLVEIRVYRKWVEVRPETEWHRVEAFLMEVEEYLGVRVIRTCNVADTVKAMVKRHNLFQRPPECHGSLKKLWVVPQLPDEEMLSLFKRPSLLRKVSSQLPHIGWEMSKAVEQRFGNTRDMINAGEDEWVEIDGVGKKIAGDIVREIISGKGTHE